ncbi:MAG: alpha/beta hydrolase [Burkholderiaceae bacterium]
MTTTSAPIPFTQKTDVLTVSGLCYGQPSGVHVYLMHGFPYDIACYQHVAPALAAKGCFVVVPFLRGFGTTRFNNPVQMRSGEQSALGNDLLGLMDAFNTKKAVLAGFDWGGRAACVVAALWPERAIGLVSGDGYNIQNIAASGNPATPRQEFQHWYQYYFHSERGRAGLSQNRKELCKLLWSLWSPLWGFSDEEFNETAPSFDNPDFVDVVIHSYRHRYALVAGDPTLQHIDSALALQPKIVVPSIVLIGQNNGVVSPQPDAHIKNHFDHLVKLRKLPRIGHNLPQEAPAQFTEAVISLL